MQLTKPLTMPQRPTLGSFGRRKATGLTGLNIEAGTVAAVEVAPDGNRRLAASAVGPLAPGVFHEGEVTDSDGLVSALKALFAEYKLPKRVRLGIGNQRVIVRTLRLPAIEDPKSMEAAIRFQAQEQIPMPLDQAVLQHQVVGGVAGEEGSGPQVDVVVIAARRDMVTSFLDPLRAAGLEPVGIDLSAFGMIRALAAGAVPQPSIGPEGAIPAPEATLYCNVGDVMNLAVARGRSCLFTRVSGTGMEAITGRVASECGLTPDLAEQWLVHVGLEGPVAEIAGDPEIVASSRRALQEGAASLVDELRLSLDYYRALESAVPVSSIVICGMGSAVRGLAAEMEAQVGLPIDAQRPASLSGFADGVAARLVVPFGLALES
jgi:type IV pilus assembly protein PilM